MSPTPHLSTSSMRAAKMPVRGSILSILGDVALANVLETDLAAKGFVVVRARHAMHGVWLAITGSPDAIVTDQIKPSDESSYLLDCLKRNPNTAVIPIISIVDSLKQTEPAVSRLGEVAACFLRTAPSEQLIGELDQQIATKSNRSAAPASLGGHSPCDAFFAELGHNSPKPPWFTEGYFRTEILEPTKTLFPSQFKVDPSHGNSPPPLLVPHESPATMAPVPNAPRK